MSSEPKRPVNVHQAYHAHIYFDADTVGFVEQLTTDIARQFDLQVGRIHQKLVGPHTRWSVQILFSDKDFDRFVPWLDQQRKDLTVLVHGQTGDAIQDHTEFAYWLGDSVAIDLNGLK